MHILIPWRKHMQSFKNRYKTVRGVALPKGTHCVYIKSTNDLVHNVEKETKIIEQLYPNHLHILVAWRKHMQSFKMIGTKL